MIGWLRRLFTGEPDCQHEYETVEQQELRRENGTVAGFFYVLRCKKCGWVCHRILRV